MKNKENFYEFVNKMNSNINFEAVLKYYQKASLDERMLFYNRINYIIGECLNYLISINESSLKKAKCIYEKYGIYDFYFEGAANLYIIEHLKEPLVKEYIKLLHQENASHIFLEAKKGLWENHLMNKLARKYFLTFHELKVLLEVVAKEEYNLSSIDFAKYKLSYKCLKKFLSQNRLKSWERKKAYSYIENYATKNEITYFKKYVNSLLKEIIPFLKEDEVFDEKLKEMNLNTYDLLVFITNTTLDVSIKKRIIAKFRKYYEYALQENFMNKNMEEQAKIWDMSVLDILSLAKYYGTYVLKIENIEEAISSYKHLKFFSSPSYQLLESLKDKSIEEMIECFKTTKVTAEKISNFCYAIHLELSKEEQRKLEQTFLKALKSSCERKVAVKKEQDDSIYYEYLSSSYDFKEFCKLKNTTTNYFKNRIKQLKNKLLQERVISRVEKETAQMNENKALLCVDLLRCIKEGITIDGITREFTLFDYFYYFKDTNIHEFNFAKLSLPIPDQVILKKFFQPLKIINNINKNTILTTIYEIDAQKDEFGYPIRGTGRRLSQEELEEIIDIFTSNNIPFYDRLFNIALRYYSKGILIAKGIILTK